MTSSDPTTTAYSRAGLAFSIPLAPSDELIRSAEALGLLSALSPLLLDLEEQRLLVLHLKRRVADLEAFVEDSLEPAAGVVAIAVAAHPDVRRQRWELGGDLPDVEVVDLDDARLPDERAADLVGVESRRCRLHEHAPGRPQEHPGRAEHEGDDGDR